MILGKVDSGKLSNRDSLMLMPNKVIALSETMFIFSPFNILMFVVV